MNRIGFVSVIVCLVLIGCAKNFNQFVDRKLEPELLYNKMRIDKIDLSKKGQCPGTLKLRMINTETRTAKHKLRDHPTGEWYVKPKGFIDSQGYAFTI